MRAINANEAVKAILYVRDNDLHHGYPRQFELCAIRKALRCIEETPTLDLVDKIASFFEKEENWKALKNCWIENDRSDDLRKLLNKAIMDLEC